MKRWGHPQASPNPARRTILHTCIHTNQASAYASASFQGHQNGNNKINTCLHEVLMRLPFTEKQSAACQVLHSELKAYTSLSSSLFILKSLIYIRINLNYLRLSLSLYNFKLNFTLQCYHLFLTPWIICPFVLKVLTVADHPWLPSYFNSLPSVSLPPSLHPFFSLFLLLPSLSPPWIITLL